jgi:hypothetical protein
VKTEHTSGASHIERSGQVVRIAFLAAVVALGAAEGRAQTQRRALPSTAPPNQTVAHSATQLRLLVQQFRRALQVPTATISPQRGGGAHQVIDDCRKGCESSI